MQAYISELNDAQRVAVVNTEGPILVLAGAGSGKTKTLTYKIAYLISKGIDPFNILALTFTNKAAREMKERVELLLGTSNAKNVWLGTFHATFARILRSEAEKLGYSRHFTIYDTEDSKRVIKGIVKNLNLDDKIYKASTVLGRISSAKSSLIDADDYISNAELIENDKIMRRPEMGKIFKTYSEKCFVASAMDFDDLLLNMNILLRDFPEVLNKYQRLFKYILVDEYQDTNYAQYMIVKKLAANNENITVVGDDAQSIYSFRGANIENILNLKKDYPDIKIFKLEQNYRSTQNIVNAANSVIKKNKNQFYKEIWTENQSGDQIDVVASSSDGEEARKIASKISSLIEEEQMVYKNFAILYRTNAQSRSLEEALRAENIPYRIYGSISFYQRKEIKDLIAYFRLVLNSNDDDALLRVINYPARGIGKTTLDRLIVLADMHKVTLWDVITNSKNYNLESNSGVLKKIEDFVLMIQSMKVLNNTKNAFESASQIAKDSGILRDLFEDKSTEGVGRLENLEELLNGIREFVENKEEDEDAQIKTLGDYIQNISLLTDADTDVTNTEVVSLMTIHAAKGLEFPCVFLSGVEENLFPSLMALNTRSELEEERRLFYVAITRAMKKLFIHYAESRFKWGNLNFCEPSRFIDEIDPRYLNFVDNFSFSKPKTESYIPKQEKQEKPYKQKGECIKKVEKTPPPGFKKVYKSSSPPQTQNEKQDFEVGMFVMHEKFGKGQLISLEGSGDSHKAIVLFEKQGQKQLLLKYARLKII
ncbi:MAG: 3'-5' exonuclease [Bacteroidales bacterium]|nr:3'-5' exonuclease [Bacteroidales bacterium]